MPEKKEADLVLLSGKIVTVDPANPQVSALAVKGEKIVAAGNDSQIRGWIGPKTRELKLNGKLVIPGWIDSHGHFAGLGYFRMQLDLTRARNWSEIVGMVEKAAMSAKPDEWIVGRGWHQERWDKPPEENWNGLPCHHSLTRVSPKNPVLLIHASGHSCVANQRAMDLAGVDAQTRNPIGGEIVRDGDAKIIGVFHEAALELVRAAYQRDVNALPSSEREEREIRAVLRAQEECLAKGITGFHDAGVSFAAVDRYRRLIQEGRLKLRLNVMIDEPNSKLRQKLSSFRIVEGTGHRMTVRGIKRLLDGALGSHTAWLLKPYLSLPGELGLNTEPLEAMREAAEIAVENDFQLCTHAIGDRANREILNIYEEVFRRHSDKKNLRWRVEHAQHLHPDDIPRFGKLGIISAMQTCQVISDGPWVVKRLGEERAAEGAYVWRKLLDGGALISNSSDAPVEDVDPLPGFYAAVTRRLKDKSRFYPAQCLTREEALRSYTWCGAYASFEEEIKGSLAPGKLADMTVLSRDILTCPEPEILQTRVLYTIIGGQILYQNPVK